jgi:hypothetical protein
VPGGSRMGGVISKFAEPHNGCPNVSHQTSDDPKTSPWAPRIHKPVSPVGLTQGIVTFTMLDNPNTCCAVSNRHWTG